MEVIETAAPAACESVWQYLRGISENPNYFPQKCIFLSDSHNNIYETQSNGERMQDEKPTNENRTHKDSLFVDYFSKDRDWKQHFLSLYNALHGTNLQVETTKLERVNLEQVLYMDYYNDIAVMVNDQFILMIEHQATINPNMPLRLLEYVTRIYGNKVDSKTKFSNQLIPLAKPEFFVFYTGKENIPPESYLYLSDAFPKDPSEKHLSDLELTLELVLKVCKIKGESNSTELPRLGAIRAISQAHRQGKIRWTSTAPHKSDSRGGTSQHLKRLLGT